MNIDWSVFEGREQIGRLAISHHRHATGESAWIVVLPEGEAAKWNSAGNAPLNTDGVIVWGYTNDQNSKQAWLHIGPWQDDFYAEMNRRITERKARLDCEADERRLAELAEIARQARLLDNYPRKTGGAQS